MNIKTTLKTVDSLKNENSIKAVNRTIVASIEKYKRVMTDGLVTITEEHSVKHQITNEISQLVKNIVKNQNEQIKTTSIVLQSIDKNFAQLSDNVQEWLLALIV